MCYNKFMRVKPVEFKQIYDDMLTQFPPEELKPYERFCEISGKNYKAYEFGEDEPVGYAVIFEAEDYILVDYLAVYKKFHSLGYGKKFLTALSQIFPNKKGVLFEVEKPDKTKINTLRRIKFYESNGAQKININYFYPASEKPLSMDLYCIGEFDTDEVKKFIKYLFSSIHNDCACLEKISDLMQL